MFANIPYKIKPSRVINYLRFLEQSKGPAPFGILAIEHFSTSACKIFIRSEEYHSSINNVPISKIYGVQNRYVDPGKQFPTFKEVLFHHLNGYDRNFDKQWPIKTLKYFLSEEHKDSLNGGPYLHFPAPGSGGGFQVAKVGQRYYAINGQHRVIAGMFYKYFRDGLDSEIVGVRVDTYDVNDLYVSTALQLLKLADDSKIYVCKNTEVYFKMKLYKDIYLDEANAIALSKFAGSRFGKIRAFFHILKKSHTSINVDIPEWFELDINYINSLKS